MDGAIPKIQKGEKVIRPYKPKHMKQHRIFRGVALFLTLLLLAVSFVGCRNSASTGLTPSAISTNTENSGTDLKPVATMVGSVYTASYDTRAMLIASFKASRKR